MYDIIIVGAGPAGLTAAIYALRFGKSVLVIEKETFGGQITYSPKVENYPGYKEMSGNEFADKLINQVTALGGELELDTICKISTDAQNTNDKIFRVQGESGSIYEAAAVIIAAGSKHRELGLENEARLVGNGISYCAVCDGAFFAGKDIAVIGGGNTALQEAVLLAEICGKVYIIQNLAYLTGEKTLVNALCKKPNVELICNTVVTKLIGEDHLKAIMIRSSDSPDEARLDLDGIFVAIGQKPENEAFSDLCELNENGYIIADESCKLTTPGIFVAGDCRTKQVRQIATAVGDGATAAVNACRYIDSLK